MADDQAATEQAAAAAPAKEKLPQQNGVTRPGTGQTLRVWEIAEKLSEFNEDGSIKKAAPRKDVLAAFTAEQGNASTGATQYGRFRKFHGLSGKEQETPVASETPEPAAATA
jgi:hypothetical protein